MKIQIITNNSSKGFSKDIDVNTLGSPMSFDNYDLNIIDLTNEQLWRFSGSHLNTIDSIDDFDSISDIVSTTKNAKVLFVFPHNSNILWNYSLALERYTSNDKIKNRLDFLVNSVLSHIVPCSDCAWFMLTFERNKTIVDSNTYESDFFFSSPYIVDEEKILTKSISKRITSFTLSENIILTTCDILQSQETMMSFIDNCFYSSSNDGMPSWVQEYEFYNDKDLGVQLEKERKIVEETENRIKNIMHSIELNNEYKSILYTYGKQLENIVFSILQTILDVDLSEFKDVCKEDFIIEKGSIVFIGEIKGVTNNVKFEYLSQIMRHFSFYADEHLDTEVKNIKPILIINPFRNTPINEREPIHINQIKFAKQNNCLIIETSVLLKLYEKFLNDEVSTDDCVKILFNNIGLLKL